MPEMICIHVVCYVKLGGGSLFGQQQPQLPQQSSGAFSFGALSNKPVAFGASVPTTTTGNSSCSVCRSFMASFYIS